MALLHIDGFDHYATSGNVLPAVFSSVYSVNGTMNIRSMPQIGGRGIVGVSSLNNSTKMTFPLPGGNRIDRTIGIGAHVAPLSLSNFVRFFGFNSLSGTRRYSVGISSGTLCLYSAGSTILATGPVLTTDVVYHVEIKLVQHATSGSIEVRLDGVLVIKVDGINTATEVGSVGILITNTNPGTDTTVIDNLYVWDNAGVINNDWFGPMIVDTLFPTSDDAVAEWAPASGVTGYEMINNVPQDPAQYVEATTVNDASKYGITYAPAFDATIRGVAVYINTMRTGTELEDVLFGIDAGIIDGEITTPPEGYSYREHIAELNPATGTAWTIEDIDNSKLHIERLS